MTEYLTIDIGGTDIKYGLMDKKGFLKNRGKRPTPKNLKDFLMAVQILIDQYQNVVDAFAFSVPGKVDTQTTTVYFGGALTFLNGLCFNEVFESYGKPIAVQNDGKAAALAELWLGHLKGVENGAVLVLGTGVGGGVVLDGKLRLGPHFQAGEFSFMSSNFKSSKCELAGFTNSAVGMIESINDSLKHPKKNDGLAAFGAIKAGNEKALRVFQEYCHTIASQIFSLQGVLDLTTYVIGGGISVQPILIEEINRQFHMIRTSHPIVEMNIPSDLTIVAAKFGNDANLYGALYHYLESVCGV